MGVSLYLVLNNKLLRPTQRLRIVFLSIVFLVYLFLGAFLFQKLNLPLELQDRKEIIEYKDKFLEDHKCIDKAVLNDFIQVIEDARSKGIIFVENNTKEFTQNWSFGGETFFFVMTTLSTIGYGQIAPLTENGRLFCIFYLVLGVPLTMLILTLLVAKLEFELTKNLSRNRLMTYLNQKRYKIVSKDYSSLNSSKINGDKFVSKQRYIYLQTLKVGIFLFLFIYLLPSLIFTYKMEPNWTLLDSLYYCYISVTTIGFGDLVPGETQIGSDRSYYRLAVTFYLMVGVVMNMLFLNMLIRLPLITKIHNSLLKLKQTRLFKFANDEENEQISDESSKDSDNRDSDQPCSVYPSSIANVNSPIYSDRIYTNNENEIDKIESADRPTQIRHYSSPYSSKTKNI